MAINHQLDLDQIHPLSKHIDSYQLHSTSTQAIAATIRRSPTANIPLGGLRDVELKGEFAFDPNHNPFGASYKKDYDWWEALSVEERKMYHVPRFSGIK